MYRETGSSRLGNVVRMQFDIMLLFKVYIYVINRFIMTEFRDDVVIFYIITFFFFELTSIKPLG